MVGNEMKSLLKRVYLQGIELCKKLLSLDFFPLSPQCTLEALYMTLHASH